MRTTERLFPEIEGSLADCSPAALVGLVDDRRITGVLEAHDGPKRFELVLRGGEIADAESTEDGDAVESFLALEKGRYRLRQQLLLPDGEATSRRVAEGSLEEVPPAKLVRTCEKGGLTGSLRLLSDERFAELLYSAGTLTAVTLDGRQDVEATDMMRWSSGRWALVARPALEAPPRPEDSGVLFLREVEMALGDLVGVAEQGAGARTSSPPDGSPPEGAVRIVYLDTVEPLEDSASKPWTYSDKDLTDVEVFLGPRRSSRSRASEDASAEPRRAEPDAPSEPGPEPAPPTAPGSG